MTLGLMLLSFPLLVVAQSSVATLPATYAAFSRPTTSAEIVDALQNGTGVTALYLAPGNYFLDNAVVNSANLTPFGLWLLAGGLLLAAGRVLPRRRPAA